MSIESGKLDRKLLIENPVFTRDAAGQQIPTWTAVGTVWGQRLNLKSGQHAELHPGGVDKAPGPALVATGRFLVRWRDDLAIGQRITVDGGVYILSAIEEPDRRTSLILTVTA